MWDLCSQSRGLSELLSERCYLSEIDFSHDFVFLRTKHIHIIFCGHIFSFRTHSDQSILIEDFVHIFMDCFTAVGYTRLTEALINPLV